MHVALQRESFTLGAIVTVLLVALSLRTSAEEIPPQMDELGLGGKYAIQRKVVAEAWEFRIIENPGGKPVSPSIASSSHPIAKNSHIFAWGPGRKALIAITNQGKIFDCTLWTLASDGRTFASSGEVPDLEKAAVRVLQAARPGEKNAEMLNQSMRIIQVTDAGAQGVIRFGLLADSDEYAVEFTMEIRFAAPAFVVSGARVVSTRDQILHTLDGKQTKALLGDTP